MTKLRCVAAMIPVFVIAPATCLAHDFASSGASTYKWDPARTFMPAESAKPIESRPPGLPPTLEYIVVLPKRWAIGQDIRVCFVGGDDATRRRILGIVNAWFRPDVNIRLASGSPNGVTCQINDKSEVRVGFKEPGYWSYIGTDSLHPDLLSKNLPSLNLQGFDSSPPAEPRFTGVVLHEFGHALGFHHEHQSPAGGCDKEYNWPKLYEFYQANYGWDKDKVDQNVRQLIANRSAYDWSKRDPASIMIYGSNPQFLKKGTKSKCYFHDNNALSALDLEGARTTYSKQSPALSLKARASTLEFALQSDIKGDLRETLQRQLDLTRSQMQRVVPE